MSYPSTSESDRPGTTTQSHPGWYLWPADPADWGVLYTKPLEASITQNMHVSDPLGTLAYLMPIDESRAAFSDIVPLADRHTCDHADLPIPFANPAASPDSSFEAWYLAALSISYGSPEYDASAFSAPAPSLETISS